MGEQQRPEGAHPEPSKPEYLSPFGVEIQNVEGLWLRAQKRDRILAGPETTSKITTKTSIVLNSLGNVDLNIAVALFVRKGRPKPETVELKSLLGDNKREQALEELLRAHIDPNLRIRGQEIGKFIGIQSNMEVLKKVGSFNESGSNNFTFNPQDNIASKEEFEKQLKQGLEIFKIYISERYKRNSLTIPTDILILRPDEQEYRDMMDQRALQNIKKARILKPDLKGLIDNNIVKPKADPSELKESFGQDITSKELETLRHSIVVEKRPDVTFEQIAGQPDAVSEAKDLTDQIAHPKTFAKWGVKPPRGVLLYGPPGTGKTLIAKAIAHEANAAFVQVKSADIASKWYGDSEKLIQGVFQTARNEAKSHGGTCILFLDEVDSIVHQREGTTHEATQKVVGLILQEIDGLTTEEQKEKIIVIAATNRLDQIDSAFLSRMTKWIEVPLPNPEGRSDILRIQMQAANQAAGRNLGQEDLDYQSLSKLMDGASGRDIADIVQIALGKKAVQEVKGESPTLLTNDDIKNAIESSSKIREAKKTNRSPTFGFQPNRPVK